MEWICLDGESFSFTQKKDASRGQPPGPLWWITLTPPGIPFCGFDAPGDHLARLLCERHAAVALPTGRPGTPVEPAIASRWLEAMVTECRLCAVVFFNISDDNWW